MVCIRTSLILVAVLCLTTRHSTAKESKKEVDKHSNRAVIIGAIDNLTKGTAGQAVQAINLMCGFEEATGLGFTGLHPI